MHMIEFKHSFIGRCVHWCSIFNTIRKKGTTCTNEQTEQLLIVAYGHGFQNEKVACDWNTLLLLGKEAALAAAEC
jgi:hypothetical protein